MFIFLIVLIFIGSAVWRLFSTHTKSMFGNSIDMEDDTESEPTRTWLTADEDGTVTSHQSTGHACPRLTTLLFFLTIASSTHSTTSIRLDPLYDRRLVRHRRKFIRFEYLA